MLTANYKLLGEAQDYREELVVLHNGKEIGRFIDGGEPEDNRFSRDWNWVAGMIEKAYALGRNDVHQQAFDGLMAGMKEGMSGH
jgi:hypothetical protein